MTCIPRRLTPTDTLDTHADELSARLFLIWGGVVVLLFAGTCYPVLRSIEASFDRTAAHALSGNRRDLQSLQAERIARHATASRDGNEYPRVRTHRGA